MTATNEKLRALRALVTKRQSDAAGSTLGGYSRDYKKIGDFHSGAYDSEDHVVPYSKSACNLSADIMILAQDWASEDFLAKPFNKVNADLGHDPSLPTNYRLFDLLKSYFRIEFADTYATDAFVFVKPGGMSAGIPAADFALSTTEYAVPQIEIISPKLVICLGSKPYDALRKTQKLPQKPLKAALREKIFTIGTAAVVGVHHTGGLGMAQIGGQKAQEKQWEELADYFFTSLKNR